MKPASPRRRPRSSAHRSILFKTGAAFALLGLLLAVAVLQSCAGAGEKASEEDFATSGSPEADQRAEQAMAKEAIIKGAEADEEEKQKSLYLRLGGDDGIDAIVDDAVDRALADPRVNATRAGKDGGWFGSAADAWKKSPQNVATLKKNITAFIALTAGGPAKYQGPELETAFADMQFSNVEFDAAIGCLQASMDRLGVADQEQKELLAIIETTREQVVEVR